jgi:hypothetical protein
VGQDGLVLITALATPLADVPAEKVSPGWLGLGVVVVLGIATWLLLRSMNKQLKKIDFEEQEPAGRREEPQAGPANPS